MLCIEDEGAFVGCGGIFGGNWAGGSVVILDYKVGLCHTANGQDPFGNASWLMAKNL